MLIPGSISADEVASEVVNDRSKEMIDNLYNALSGDVVAVDVYDALTNSDDYLFYRTQNNWTSRGAYKAYAVFADLIGENITPLSQYTRRATTRFNGNLFPELGDYKTSMVAKDLVETYLRENQNNYHYVTSTLKNGEMNGEKTALVSTSRSGYDTFMGGRVSFSVVPGDVENGKTMMIVGTRPAYSFIPFMTELYETIIFINPIYYKGTQDDITDLINKYLVTDLMLLETVHDLPLVRSMRVKEAN